MRELKISASITNRESAAFSRYLQDISKIPLLTPDEEVALTALIKQGDKAAQEKLVNANLRFVVSVAKQYQGKGLTLADLVNEGNIGLIRAAELFDDTKGFKFISYAVWWIRQSIMQAINEQATLIRIPQNKMNLKNKIQKAHTDLEQELERLPTAGEVAEMTGMKEDEVHAAWLLNGHHVSLDSPFSNDEESSLLDILTNEQSSPADEKMHYKDSLNKELKRSLEVLDKRQRQVICWLYGIGVEFPLSLDDIGKRYFLTRERVRQIRDKAIIKLRANKNVHMLKAFLGN
jgi:RNA polymerase primary sigma factor